MRDITYVAANMREADWEEISVQIPETWTESNVGHFCYATHNGEAFIGRMNGQPVVAIGLAPITLNGTAMSAWMFGVDGCEVAAYLAAVFLMAEVAEPMIDRGLSRIEARASTLNTVANEFLQQCGAEITGVLKHFAGPDEDFILYSWDLDSYGKAMERVQKFVKRYPIVYDGESWYFSSKHSPGPRNVPVSTEASEAACDSKDAFAERSVRRGGE